VLAGLSPGKIWLEMSTTDAAEARRLAARVEALGALAMDCPVSGGCHRAATGNISIFAGGARAAFERALPVLAILGQRILHTGPVGSASALKVLTNYLCTVHLVALTEALTVAKVAGLDLNTTYEAIRISSGNSFVHETESQVILNGSRDINFTMDLVVKDVGLFDAMASAHGVPLELSPLVLEIFRDGARRFGAREHSPNIIRRLEEPLGVRVLGEGFPAQMVDDEPKVTGYEVAPRRAPPGPDPGPDRATPAGQ
jgi:3-hydroxyisobutyrate dehydrogenase